MRSHSRRDVLALLAAACVLLSTLEYMIPKPLPFVRLGLANLPIIVGLSFLSVPEIILLTGLKALGQGLINGTIFSYVFLFSISGSFASVLFMTIARKTFGSRISLIGVSVLGALASNLVQLFLASLIVFGSAAFLVGPPLLAVGVVSSIFLGVLAEKFLSSSKWLKENRDFPGSFVEGGNKPNTEQPGSSTTGVFRISPRIILIGGLLVIPAFLLQDHVVVRVIQAVCFLILAGLSGRRIRFMPLFFMTVSVLVAHLLVPFGKVIVEIWRWPITIGALQRGAAKASLLIGLIYLSRLSVRPNLKIPGKSGRLLTRVFFYFEGLTTSWSTSRGKLLERLDHTLIKAGEAGPKETRIVEESTHTTPIGFILTFCIVSANWILLVLSKTGFLDP